MVNQKDDWAETHEAEVWELLKSYLAGEGDPAGLAQELLCLLAQEDMTAPPKAAKPAAPEQLPPTKLREPAAPYLPDGLSMNDLVRRLIESSGDDSEMAAKLKDFLHKYIE